MSNNSTVLVELALKELSCTQKELAHRLGVSATQISKWKRGEHISLEKEQALRDLAGIGELSSGLILAAGSIECAEKWVELMGYIAQDARDNNESGYYAADLEESNDILPGLTAGVLLAMGVQLPTPFPSELDPESYNEDPQNNECDLYDDDPYGDAVDGNPYSDLIYRIYRAYTDVYGFYSAFVYDLMFDDELGIHSTEAGELDYSLMALAATKIEVDPALAPDFNGFSIQTRRDCKRWLNLIKQRAMRAGIPLRAELLDLIHEESDALGSSAEMESYSHSDSRLHPDIYMNELLVGMRTVHQVLPQIMKKLEIFDEFTLDESRLRIGGR